jgi:hypothetical protein
VLAAIAAALDEKTAFIERGLPLLLGAPGLIHERSPAKMRE